MDKHGRILIVDDNADDIQVLRNLLHTDYDIAFASSGPSALEECAGAIPDLILLTLATRGIDGFEVCKWLRASEPTRDVPVVFIADAVTEQDEEQGLAIGASDFIQRPFRAALLKARVRTLVRFRQLSERLQTETLDDGLTGLANRQRFDDTLERAWRRCTRTREPVSLILVDVDHFRPYAARYGERNADECLRRVAQVLRRTLGRPDDLVARYDGDQFACLLPGTGSNGATEVAQRILAALVEAAIPSDVSPVAPVVTASIGIAADMPKSWAEPAELVATTASALEQAKADGRNRYVVA